ncbi:14303_t:CDS:2 [Entrophospora sp. SA101]|nr:14303_t:CDS:2 [Entrophospora sp. SA101]
MDGDTWILKNEVGVIGKVVEFLEDDKNDHIINEVAFNHPLLSCVIDLDVVSKLTTKIFLSNELNEMMKCKRVTSWKIVDDEMKEWVASLMKTDDMEIPSRLNHEECAYIVNIYTHLQKIWESKLFDNRQQGDGEILEDTYIHEFMHHIIYTTIRDLCPSLIRIEWGTKQSKEGNERIEQNYDQIFFKMSKTAKKTYQSNFVSSKRPDWKASYCINDHKYEFLYGEAAGPPFLMSAFKTEGDRRKIIRFLLRCNRTLRQIPRFGMLLYGTCLKIVYYDTSYKIGQVLPLLNMKLPLDSNSDQTLIENYLYGMLIFQRAIKETCKSFKDFKNNINSRMNVFDNKIYNIVVEEDVDIPRSPKRTKTNNTDNTDNTDTAIITVEE